MTASNSKHSALCGAWPSPISAAIVAAGAAPLLQVALDGADAYWLAERASEGGRTTLLRRRGADVVELTPAPFNVRTRVHEYGGGALLAADGIVVFSNFTDNRLYRINPAGDGAAPVALTAEDGRRYADFVLDRQRQRLVSVCEDHAGAGYPVNTIVAIGLNDPDGVPTVLVQGSDFYCAPRISPDGSQLAWLSWMHPRMPWQGTELWLADLDAAGGPANARLIAGGVDESICQPEWSPAGVLHFVSDRSGWWNLYRLAGAAPGGAAGAAVQALCALAAEFGMPHWAFGDSTYGFRSDDDIVCAYIEDGISRLAQLSCVTGTLAPIANPYQEIRHLRVAGSVVALLGGAPAIPTELARIDLGSGVNPSEHEVLARSIDVLLDAADLSVPESVTYPTTGNRMAHAFHYPPRNAHYQATPGSKPPLMVISHGGPTSMATSTLKLATQYWTSRGFAVLDVNYGGSSGFGRAYRDALKGQWGVIDVDDCVAGARYLVARGMVDGDRLVIRGGSAGGLTTLCALAFHDVFKAGASYYGVSDLKGLDQDSHKFESHYTDYLIAPQPQAELLYLQRSPIHHADRLKRPMIFFQGLDDKVVPPQQSEVMVNALHAAGVPVAYLTLEGEGHGFRKADSIVRTLEAELYFYRRVFGIAAPEPLAPVMINNLPAAA